MGDLRYIEGILKFLDLKETQQKLGIQGNVFRKLLNYLEIDEDEFVNYDEYRNGKAIDCLITYQSITIPINFIAYSKNKRSNLPALEEDIKGSVSLLKQFMVANSLPLGVITNGYILFFFELDGKENIKKVRNIWLANVVKEEEEKEGILSDRDFLNQYSVNNLNKTFEKYLDLDGLRTFIKENIVNISDDFVEWLYVKKGIKYPSDILQDTVRKIYYEDIFVEKREKLNKDFILKGEELNNFKQSVKEILSLDLSSFEKLRLIDENPEYVGIADDKIIEFTSYRDLMADVLNYIIVKDKNAYSNFVETEGKKSKFNVIRVGSNQYHIDLTKGNGRKLDNEDILLTSLDRVYMCKYAIKALNEVNYLKCVKPCLTFVYPDNSELNLTLDSKNMILDVDEDVGNILEDSDNKGKSYILFNKVYVYKTAKQVVEDVLDSLYTNDKAAYEEIKKLELGTSFFMYDGSRQNLLKEYHKIRKLKNNDMFVIHGSAANCLNIANLLLSHSNIGKKCIEFI